MKKLVVTLICLVIFVGALGAVLMERSVQPDSAAAWSSVQKNMTEQPEEGRSVFGELGLYIA